MNYMTAEKLAASKSVLAKLLASENIDVVHIPGVETAYFDLKNRTVVCPVWKDMEGYLYDLLLSHEVGHALYTKHDDWFNSIQKESDKPNFKNFVNIIEDVRIEKFMKRKFPGLKRSYILGNKWLIGSGFFGEKAKSPKKINDMSLIDRINMYFRVDGSVSINFTSEERVFVNRAERLSTWNDVYQLAKDIYEFEKQNSETNKNDLDEDQSDPGESEPGDGYESSGTDDQADTDGEGAGEGDTEADTDGSGSNDGDDTDKGNEGTTAPSNGDNEPKSETDEAFRRNQGNLVNNDYGNNIQNIIIPDIDPDDYVVSFNDLMNTFHKNDVEYLKNYENEVKKNLRNHKDSVDYLVKEFEMKKAADQHKRTKVSKTGVIDPTLLHSYRFNDDIFMRSSTVEEGKNHGLIIYVDWSLSMDSIISYALDQVMVLVRFCQKVNIPYVVYAFNNDNSMVKKNKVKNQKTNELIMNNFALVELISSDLKKSDNKKAFNLLQALKTNKGTYGNLRLNSTPLNQAVATMGPLYRRFKNKYNVDVLNTVFVTDGGSNESSTKGSVGSIYPSRKDSPYYITDAYTKKTSVYTDTGITMAMVDKLKQIYNMNVMNFHLVNDPEVVSQMFRIFNVDNVKVSDVKSDGYTTGNSTFGFDDVYVVWPNKVKKWSNDENVKTRTENRKKKRLMLNQFTEKIS